MCFYKSDYFGPLGVHVADFNFALEPKSIRLKLIGTCAARFARGNRLSTLLGQSRAGPRPHLANSLSVPRARVRWCTLTLVSSNVLQHYATCLYLRPPPSPRYPPCLIIYVTWIFTYPEYLYGENVATGGSISDWLSHLTFHEAPIMENGGCCMRIIQKCREWGWFSLYHREIYSITS